MRVLKFGGTSVQNFEAISRTLQIINRTTDPRVVVVSAISGATNTLLDLARYSWDNLGAIESKKLEYLKSRHLEIAEKFNLDSNISNIIINEFELLTEKLRNFKSYSNFNKFSDDISSTGEVLSSQIIAAAGNKLGYSAFHINSKQIIITDDEFSEANVNFDISNEKIRNTFSEIKDNCFYVCGGFIASNEKNETTTLGRGGSDYTAAIIGAALNVDVIEIWTDVDGIMTTDPRLVPSAKRILKITYQEAAEMAYFGAKVLHPKTILPAVSKKIPVMVLNTFNPNNTGTLVYSDLYPKPLIKAISFRRGIAIINISSNRMLGAYGFLSKVFEIFKIHKTPVDLVTTSEVSISLTIDDLKNLDAIISDLENFATVSISLNNAILSIIGEGIKLTAGVGAKFFGVLRGINIVMVSFGASEVNLSIIVHENDLDLAVKMLHKEFFDGELDIEYFE